MQYTAGRYNDQIKNKIIERACADILIDQEPDKSAVKICEKDKKNRSEMWQKSLEIPKIKNGIMKTYSKRLSRKSTSLFVLKVRPKVSAAIVFLFEKLE